MKDIKNKTTHAHVDPAPYAGRMGWRYTVACAVTREPIASGWCETEALAHKMVEKVQRPSDNQ